RAAREAGVPAMDGTLMLLAQGAAAYRCWTGREAPLETMRAALGVDRSDALGGRPAAGAERDGQARALARELHDHHDRHAPSTRTPAAPRSGSAESGRTSGRE